MYSFSVGDAAKNAFHQNPENTVFDAKRLIGRKVNDPEVKRDMRHWPFKIKAKGDKPMISVTYKDEQREFVSFSRYSQYILFFNCFLDPGGN